MAKLMAPNIRIDWYPEGHFLDPANPTVDELNGGYNLSCAVVTGFTLDFTDSNTEDTTTIFDTHTSEAILNHSYEADLEFFLAPRGSNADNEEAYRRAEELFYNNRNRVGYLAKRFGFPWNREYDRGEPRQRLDMFKVQADLPKVATEEGSPILLQVKYIPQGGAISATKAGHTVYEWEGAPHNSTSVKKVDHEIVARNLIKNPSFEHNLEGWSHYQGTTFSRATDFVDRMWDGVGGTHLLYIRVGGDNQNRVQYSLDPTEVAGRWVAARALVATGGDDEPVELQIEAQAPSGNMLETLQHTITARFYTGRLLSGVAQIPSDATSVRVFIRFRGGDDGRGWVDLAHASVGDTEEEALAQIQNYFDGDTVGK